MTVVLRAAVEINIKMVGHHMVLHGPFAVLIKKKNREIIRIAKFQQKCCIIGLRKPRSFGGGNF
jgi:hypothetical protein